MLNGVTWVSPLTMRTPASGTPNSSAASCASVVWWPWPCGVVPATTVTFPVALMRTVAASHPPAA